MTPTATPTSLAAARAEKKMFTFRCYTRPYRGQVMAESIDLDLAVVRPTIEAAKQELEVQIELHLQTVLENGWPIKRHAPFKSFLIYVLVVAVHNLRESPVGAARRRFAHGRIAILRAADAWNPAFLPTAA